MEGKEEAGRGGEVTREGRGRRGGGSLEEWQTVKEWDIKMERRRSRWW